jgi:hypothetical protein
MIRLFCARGVILPAVPSSHNASWLQPSLSPEAETMLPLAQAARLLGLSQGVLRHLLPSTSKKETALQKAKQGSKAHPSLAEGYLPLRQLTPTLTLSETAVQNIKPIAASSLKGFPPLTGLTRQQAKPTHALAVPFITKSALSAQPNVPRLPSGQCFEALLQHFRQQH